MVTFAGFIPFRKSKFSIAVVILLIQLFLFTQRDLLFGSFAEQIQQTFLAYFILLLAALASLNARIPLGPRSGEKPINFLLGFFVTSAGLLAFGTIAPQLFTGLILGSVEPAIGGVVGVIAAASILVFVKVFSEEIVFRNLLPKQAGLGDIASAILFGIFHLAVTGVSIPSMILLMVMGLVWAMMRNRFGLMGSVGSHAAWNFSALGILPLVFGLVM